MFKLFRDTSFECAQLITERYSTSFTLGIRTFDKEIQPSIFGIYGFVRYADEIVDTFHDFDKKQLLDEFRVETFKAIERKISLNPVLDAFQQVVNQYQIDHKLIEAFLYSMEMDLDKDRHESESYDTYIYGSAEVVGLMCLKVFVYGDVKLYEELKESACKLGSAFQKVNFLRDMKSDFEDRGRVYFPGVDFTCFNDEMKSKLEVEILQEFDEAYNGIIRLPSGSKLGVYLAYRYYKSLFKRIKNAPALKIQQERVRVPDQIKLFILAGTYLRSYARMI